jgi:predicted N-acyltransferase
MEEGIDAPAGRSMGRAGQTTGERIYLRDFPADDLLMRDFFIDQGFVRADLPDSHVLYNPPFDSLEEYLAHLNSKKRKHVRLDALDKSAWFDVERITQASPAELDRLYTLYENVHSRSFEINTFKLPKKFLSTWCVPRIGK